eukprot:3198311-Ditylum_brightwellii.AAC.1
MDTVLNILSACQLGDEDGVEDGVEDGRNNADKHLTHLSQAVNCILTKRSEQNKLVGGNKDDGVDDYVDNGDDNGVEDSNDDGVEDGVEGADKHLTHLSQAINCNLTKRSKQKKHIVCEYEDDVNNSVEEG